MLNVYQINQILKGLAVGLALLVSNAALAQMSGTMMVVKGEVTVISAKDKKESKAKVGTKVFEGDGIVTGADSRAKIVMADKNTINVTPDSKLIFERYENDPTSGKKNVILNVMYGKMRADVKQKYNDDDSKFRVKTPSAVAGVRGTDFLTSYNSQTKASQVVTFEGAVDVGAPGPGGQLLNPVRVNPGEFTQAMAGQPPAPPAALPAQELSAMNTESNVTPSSPGEAQPEAQPRQPADAKKEEPAKQEPAKQEPTKPQAAATSPSAQGQGPAQRMPANAPSASAMAPRASDLPQSGSSAQNMMPQPIAANIELPQGAQPLPGNLTQIQQTLQNVQDTVQNLGSAEVLIRLRLPQDR